VVAADVYLFEVGFVARRWTTSGELPAESARVIAEVAWTLPRRVVEVGIADMHAAWALTAHTGWADAVHVAVAQRLDAELWTTDQRLAANPQVPCPVRLLATTR
jgi:predicted nucleic acid-binding protein